MKKVIDFPSLIISRRDNHESQVPISKINWGGQASYSAVTEEALYSAYLCPSLMSSVAFRECAVYFYKSIDKTGTLLRDTQTNVITDS